MRGSGKHDPDEATAAPIRSSPRPFCRGRSGGRPDHCPVRLSEARHQAKPHLLIGEMTGLEVRFAVAVGAVTVIEVTNPEEPAG
jgi:hypothetical protein